MSQKKSHFPSLQVKLSEYLFNINKFDTNFIIAKVMLDRISEIPDISIDKIAYLANTTPSTVTKFCKKLGYDGYASIKAENQIPKLNTFLTNNDYKENCTSPLEFYSLYSDQIKIVYDLLYEQFDHQQIARIAWQLSFCKKVTIFTGLHGFAATNLFNEMMRTFDIIVYEINRNSEISIIKSSIEQSDMIFIISLTGKWVKDNMTSLNKDFFQKYLSKIVVLSNDASLPFKEIINFSAITNFYDSNYISSNSLQAFFILLASYLAYEYNKESTHHKNQ